MNEQKIEKQPQWYIDAMRESNAVAPKTYEQMSQAKLAKMMEGKPFLLKYESDGNAFYWNVLINNKKRVNIKKIGNKITLMPLNIGDEGIFMFIQKTIIKNSDTLETLWNAGVLLCPVTEDKHKLKMTPSQFKEDIDTKFKSFLRIHHKNPDDNTILIGQGIQNIMCVDIYKGQNIVGKLGNGVIIDGKVEIINDQNFPLSEHRTFAIDLHNSSVQTDNNGIETLTLVVVGTLADEAKLKMLTDKKQRSKKEDEAISILNERIINRNNFVVEKAEDFIFGDQAERINETVAKRNGKSFDPFVAEHEYARNWE